MIDPGFEWRRILLEAAVIAALGAVIGLSLHWRLVLHAFEGEGGAAVTAVAPVGGEGPVPASLAEVRELLNRNALAVDARSREAWREEHLPNALSLPLGEFDAQIAGFRDRVPATTVLITYCSGYGCPDSFDLALRLTEEGYRVRVFEGGLPQWRDAGLPVVQEKP